MLRTRAPPDFKKAASNLLTFISQEDVTVCGVAYASAANLQSETILTPLQVSKWMLIFVLNENFIGVLLGCMLSEQACLTKNMLEVACSSIAIDHNHDSTLRAAQQACLKLNSLGLEVKGLSESPPPPHTHQSTNQLFNWSHRQRANVSDIVWPRDACTEGRK